MADLEVTQINNHFIIVNSKYPNKNAIDYINYFSEMPEYVEFLITLYPPPRTKTPIKKGIPLKCLTVSSAMFSLDTAAVRSL